MISVKRKQFQAIYTPFSCHLPENSIFFCFWQFYTICAYSRATPSSHFHFYWQNCYHWVLLQWYLQRDSYYRLLPLHFPAICLKIELLVIFGHFSPFVPAHGRPLDHISIFIDKNVNTGCCCNEIYEEKANPGYCHPILPPFPWYFNFGPFLAFFGHFSPFVPVCGPPLDPISAFIDKNVISGCCCNDIYQ